ncbi:MAG: ABC transporter ATP-binding protein [Thermoproteota archaeon]|nr:MAG: ABC transporter ATP-binding protein [Candidatus Korarchaeota archaeon]RLG51830.1 MAG: ABC transporter ATP-binding protein [Candidatus Korarchaeota archaeon]
MPVLEARGIYGGYGKAVVVQGVDMYLDEGELVALVGPNGSGKSTLLKTILGLATLFKGKVYFMGEDITRVPPERKVKLGLGYVPQVANVFPDLTVEENLEMGGYLISSKQELKERIREMYRMFPILEERRRQKAAVLSGGERQMLAVARALMIQPKVLLLDEPAAGLAPKAAGEFFKKLREIREAGTPILLVEQHARRALSIADRGYVLVAGRKALEGAGREILENKDLKKVFLGMR